MPIQFVRPDELDPMYLDTPYYVGPDGAVAEESFGVLREALRRAKRIGIGRVVLGGKEKLVALKPASKGFVFFTLRYPAERQHCDRGSELLEWTDSVAHQKRDRGITFEAGSALAPGSDKPVLMANLCLGMLVGNL